MIKKIMLISILFILVGCTTGPFQKDVEEDIHKGNTGLVMNFFKGTPPKTVHEGETFPVTVELRNKGAYDIQNGDLLINIEQDLLELKEGELKEDLDIEGKSTGNIEGSLDKKTFLLKSKNLGKETETITSNIIVSACYKYRTVFSEDVCIDTDYYNTKGFVKACTAETSTFSSGQGGPISITKVEAKMLAEDDMIIPKFDIYISNYGTGQVIKDDEVDDLCSSKTVDKEDINFVKVSVDLFEESLDCNKETLVLKEGSGFIRCSLTNGISKDTPSYTSLLTVTLDYGYSESISQSVEIKKEI